jgi:hypothetical protein
MSHKLPHKLLWVIELIATITMTAVFIFMALRYG